MVPEIGEGVARAGPRRGCRVRGGGGGGGSFVAADVINPTFQRSSGQGTVRGESRDGIGQYAFCVSK